MYLLAAATISGQHPGFLHPDSPSGYTEGEGRVVQLFIQEWQEQSLFTEMAATAAKIRQSCLTLCDPIDVRPPGSRPWDSPGKNTGVGCHFLLQCMEVKSESKVAQSCPTLATPWTAAYQAPPSMGFPRQEYCRAP